MIKTGQVFLPPHTGTNKLTLEGYDHLTWRYKLIPYIRTDNCTNMSNMFSGANYSLPETLDLRAFNTSNVTTMRSMFDNCMSEEILGLDNFNTSNVEDMAFMFNASKATELDLSNFDTSNVTTMSHMFSDSSVEEINVSNFNTASVTDMSSMFENIAAEISVDNFDTSAVTTMANMFKNTSGTTLDLSGFDTSKVTNMEGMFYNAEFEEINTSSFDTSAVTNMKDMFRINRSIQGVSTLDISNFDMSNVTDMSYMLSGNNLDSLVFPTNFDASHATNIVGLFNGVTIPSLDLRGISFPSAESQINLFLGLTTNILDISDWDLGVNANNDPIGTGYQNYTTVESIFMDANIHELRFSNSNVFPENYNVCHMFCRYKTDGVLDVSKLSFNHSLCFGHSTTAGYSGMFAESHINTLIMGNVTTDEFAFNIDTGSNPSTFFGKASVELLDMSDAIIRIRYGNFFFNGLTATRINMPKWICIDTQYIYSLTSGRAKYVDYSSVDTRSANYTDDQWHNMSQYITRYNKVVWIPSTFVLNGNYTMDYLTGDVYTDALNYGELGWSGEPSGAIMHYGTTHADFEQAILDDSDDWVSPTSGYPIFFCHTHVPLGSSMTMSQFDANYGTVYLNDEVVTEGYVFNETGSFTLKVIVDGYPFTQKITVVNHGTSYTVVGTCQDYQWNPTNLRYDYATSTCVQCRLYPDKYLFVYPIGGVMNSDRAYTTISIPSSPAVVKVSGVPFEINRINFNYCSQLTDISELIVCSRGGHGFNPSSMFYTCSRLVDVSVIDKWNINLFYSELYNYNGRAMSRGGYYTYSSMFNSTAITTAPRIRINKGSNGVFSNCTHLTDISKLERFSTDGDGSSYSYNNIFYGCSSLSNVSRLKDILQFSGTYSPVSLNNFLYGTAVTNTDFIPDEGITVSSINNMFYNCSRLTDLSGMSRINWPRTAYDFNNVFYGTPATDYSPLSIWDCHFTSIGMSNTKISNLSFMEDWDLENCTTYEFGSCTNLTSISALSGKINTTSALTMSLYYCTSLTSLVGLEGCIFSSANFGNCTSLTALNGLQGCTFNYATSLFGGCTSLNDISVLSDVIFNVTNIDGMFSGCSSLTNLNGLQGLDISNFTSLSSVFSGCTSLYDLSAIAGWNPYQVRNVYGLFYICRSITSFASLHNWTTSQLTNMNNTFYGCESLVNLDGLVGFNPSQCTSLASVFRGCTALKDISDITYWYVGNCTNMSQMFYGCVSLESINPIKNWNIARLTNMSYMFNGDTSIADAEVLENWNNIKQMTTVSRSYAFGNVPKPWPSWAIS